MIIEQVTIVILASDTSIICKQTPQTRRTCLNVAYTSYPISFMSGRMKV